MTWNVEYTDEFGEWWDILNEGEQEDINSVVEMLEVEGPSLPYPYSTGIKGSRFSHMRELRVQHKGEPYRILYAFDTSRSALLLIGACKTGDDRWYEKMIPLADRLYEQHLQELK